MCVTTYVTCRTVPTGHLTLPAARSVWYSAGEEVLCVILGVLAADSGLCIAGRNQTISTVAPNKIADPSPSS